MRIRYPGSARRKTFLGMRTSGRRGWRKHDPVLQNDGACPRRLIGLSQNLWKGPLYSVMVAQPKPTRRKACLTVLGNHGCMWTVRALPRRGRRGLL